MVMRDWRERQVFMMLSMEYCADSVVGLEGGDTKRPACDLVVGAACEPSQEKADGRSMMAERGVVVSLRGLVFEMVGECDDRLLARSVFGIARVKARQMRCCGCYCWLLDMVDARARELTNRVDEKRVNERSSDGSLD